MAPLYLPASFWLLPWGVVRVPVGAVDSHDCIPFLTHIVLELLYPPLLASNFPPSYPCSKASSLPSIKL